MGTSVIEPFDFKYLNESRIIFGVNASLNLTNFLEGMSVTKVLFVTDQGIVKAGLLDKIVRCLKPELKYTVFDRVEENPTVDCVDKCTKAIVENKCDAVVAVGGGSSIDTAKMAAVLATNGGTVYEYVGVNKIVTPPLTLFSIPTTAGTGSEVSPFSIITDKRTKQKLAVASSLISPKIAILDPALLASLPKQVAANTSMDALGHNIEYYLSKSAVPVSEAINLRAIRMIGENIRQFVADPSNTEAAGNMQLAAMMGEISFGYARMTVCHAMSLPPTSHLDVPHGAGVAVLLPPTMKFNLMSCPGKFRDVAIALGEETGGLSQIESADKAVQAVERLNRDLGIPDGFRVFGMKEEHIESFAKEVFDSGMLKTNPRRVRFEDLIEIYKMSF